ncbi:hypothetical protein HPG69_003755 [Diceros bicornis minor]|uniref:Uncharacterized protein n=1 Tax=Diceros bicornis minor TaxID=77932 RepID=A0A7J7ETU6_DICBM|nr:hypothetical protein HPG69_003755 [Diceros bicornis minor]
MWHCGPEIHGRSESTVGNHLRGPAPSQSPGPTGIHQLVTRLRLATGCGWEIGASPRGWKWGRRGHQDGVF